MIIQEVNIIPKKFAPFIPDCLFVFMNQYVFIIGLTSLAIVLYIIAYDDLPCIYWYNLPIGKLILRQFIDLGGDIRLITKLKCNAKYLAYFNVALYF